MADSAAKTTMLVQLLERMQGGDPAAIRPRFDPPAPADDGDLDRWCQFHQEVAMLPEQAREVVGLIYYHGWTQAQVADLFQVNVRTVRRWWQAALVELHRALQSDSEENTRS